MNPKRGDTFDCETLSLTTVFHEIEGRLASITMFSGELADGDPGWLRDRLMRIHHAATEMQRVIEAVRRLDDQSPPERIEIDLSALCSRILERHLIRVPTLERALIRIQSNLRIEGDPDQVDILLDNLIGNAVKFTSHRESAQIRITASNESNRLVVHVSDNGVGIAPEDATRIFEPFTRCHSAFSGTGVGLATARRIVQRHGGRIWATGEPGLGTTVSFYL